MAEPNQGTIWREGLWHNNPGLVQLLGLCPLLAVSTTTVNGLGLGLATLLVLVVSNTTVSLIRRFLRPEIRIPAFVMVIAATVTAVDLILQAFFPGLSRSLGIFIPLIVTNCTIIARAEAFASRQTVSASVSDGLAQGIGFALVLIVLGSIRELAGSGTLFSDMHLLLGEAFAGLEWQLLPRDWSFLLAILPPGAFIALGLMVAVRQAINLRARPSPAIGNQPDQSRAGVPA